MSAASPSIVHGPTACPQTAVGQEQPCSLGDVLSYLAEYEILVGREHGAV